MKSEHPKPGAAFLNICSIYENAVTQSIWEVITERLQALHILNIEALDFNTWLLVYLKELFMHIPFDLHK